MEIKVELERRDCKSSGDGKEDRDDKENKDCKIGNGKNDSDGKKNVDCKNDDNNEVYNKGVKLFKSGKIEEAMYAWMSNEHAYHRFSFSYYPHEIMTSSLWPEIESRIVKLAEEKNHALAYYVLFESLRHKHNNRNIDDHISLCRKAAELKSLNGCHNMSWYHAYIKADYKKAIEYLLPIAEHFPSSRHRIVNYYRNIKDYNNAIYWCKKGILKNDHLHCDLARSYMDEAASINPSNQELKTRTLLLARKTCVDGFCDNLCDICSEFLIDTFDMLDKSKLTSEEINNMCDYYHSYGICLVADENEGEKKKYFNKLERFYEEYKNVIDFDEEYRKVIMMISVGVNTMTNISVNGMNKNNYKGKGDKDIYDGDGDGYPQIDFKEFNFEWGKNVLLLLIRRPECRFHQHSSNYTSNKNQIICKEY